MTRRFTFGAAFTLVLAFAGTLHAQIAITEIMYHPVENAAFNADGSPVMDLYEDVHEFVELFNPGSSPIDLSGWDLSGGIHYPFPTNTVIASGEYLVVAKDPARLKAVPEYHLDSVPVLGPYTGQLSNKGDTVRVRDAAGHVVDSVSYSSAFPWAISADALGADDEWTGLNSDDYQYRGRSLERVSLTASGNDPANWLASPIPGNPSPGRPNAVSRPTPAPIVIDFSAVQDSDQARLIRAGQPVRISCQFSSGEARSGLQVEWFVDDPDAQNEPTQLVPMAPDSATTGPRFTATLPGQPDRTLVRFRIRGNRGAGDEVISPRSDDPFAWHAYFVTPVRTSSKPIYDCLISAARLQVLQTNIAQNPRRVIAPDPPGNPRPSWNATEPAVVIWDGAVYDIRMRYHGSRYNRTAGRNSFKWQFPRYRKFQGVSAIFETDKGDDFVVAHGLFRAAGFPVSPVRYVDLYLNDRAVMQRLEQGEFDADMLDQYHRDQQALNPGSALESTGEIYKDVGTIDVNGEGPYGRGDGRRLSKPGYWTDLQMYDWTYALQIHGWRGSYDWKQMIDAYWAARGDTPDNPNPNIPAMRTFFEQNFDVDEMLSYIALENWSCPWDDTTQNHFFWRKRNGKWGMLPWDNDAWFGSGENAPASASLFMGEVGDPNNNWRGPNFFKDGFIKAFRDELKQRFFLLNNTFLHPDNLAALGFGSINSFAQQRMGWVNQQCGLGTFERPDQPTAFGVTGGATALPPAALQASAYAHSADPAPAHARTTWEIRAADGSYSAPVWKLVSSNDLTSTAIPFDKLRFGQTYFWRTTYEDVNGHPSLPSAEASFTFGPSRSQSTFLAIDANTTWRYDQSGTDFSTRNWMAPEFDDSAWAAGPALLAKEEAALPYPIRTPLTLGRTTYYFRTRFDFPASSNGAALQMRYVIDDGAVIYLNGKELTRVRMPDGPVSAATYASQNVSDAVEEGPFQIPAGLVQTGDNVVAVEVHQSNASSSDITFGLSIDGTLASGAGMVVLNEVSARHSASTPPAGSDWVELFNTGTAPIDLAGYSLSDDVLRPERFVFPPNTILPAQGFLVVWCDTATTTGLHTGFALNQSGETLVLYSATGGTLQVSDYVSYGPQATDLSVGRVPDGTGDWQLGSPTPGSANRVQPVGSTAVLKINEWMAEPESGNDWFELYNPGDLPVALAGLWVTDNAAQPTNTRLPDLSFVGPHGFTKLVADGKAAAGTDHVGFKLSVDGEVIGLFGTNGVSAIDLVRFGPQVAGVSEGRWPDGADNWIPFPGSASPGAANRVATTSSWQLSIGTDMSGGAHIQITGSGSGQLALQASSDLVHWDNVQTRPAGGGSFPFTDLDAGAHTTRYYRVVVTP